MIRLKRVYERATPGDGQRVLVERLWPRGLSKDRAGVDLWLKDIAPSPELRKWFDHEPARWEAFCRRYWDELETKGDLVRQLKALSRRGPVTLVYAARDEARNSAVALKAYISKATGSKKKK